MWKRGPGLKYWCGLMVTPHPFGQKFRNKLRAARNVLPDEPTLVSIEAMIWAHRGEKRKAEQAIQRALRGGKSLLHTHHMWHNAAAAYATIGKPAPAIALLRKAS